MEKLKYLNVGCGIKFHENWYNVDMVSNSPCIKQYNLLKGIPFEDNEFDVVYHSQVLEHFSKEQAQAFISECYRVLRPGGIIRVVVPDLENIVKEYLSQLNRNIENTDILSQANYEWILIELFDQMVRNQSGGQMAKFIFNDDLINEEYIIKRIGIEGKHIRDQFLNRSNKRKSIKIISSKIKKLGFIKSVKIISNKVCNMFFPEAMKVGNFRLGGEVHMCMYDRFSLPQLLKQVGFEAIEIKTPFESNIPNWGKYELDVKDGEVYDPSSLFVEAKKIK